MSATIELFQERTNVEGGHQIVTRVTDSTLVPMEVFVFKQSDDSFQYVAAVTDFVYPVANDPEWTNYRQSEVTITFEDIGTALNFAADVKRRVQALVEAYTQDVDDFEGSETEVYTG